ncbi:hypothetical protein CR513_48147, partial [Mucuna pruriens]
MKSFKAQEIDGLGYPFQSSFILGQGTTNNVIVLQEIIHHMHKLKCKKGDVVNVGRWTSIKISRKSLGISYLMFTNYVLLFAKAKPSQA